MSMEVPQEYRVEPSPEPNFIMQLEGANLQFHLVVSKTIKHRIKYWLLCRMLPFKILEWK